MDRTSLALKRAVLSKPVKGNRRKFEADFVRIPESASWRVERSWQLLSDRLEELGVEFIVRLFDEFPHLLGLFPFGTTVASSAALADRSAKVDEVAEAAARRRKALRTSSVVKNHARLVMGAVGNCVAGLSDVEALVPHLRALGRMHEGVGVQPAHYDAFFRILLGTVKDFLGPEEWTEETQGAWSLAQSSIATVMKQPAAQLESDILDAWGTLMAGACAYMAVVSPYQLAGFGAQNSVINSILCHLDGAVAVCCALEIFGWIAAINRRTNILHSLRMDCLVAWPLLDTAILLSYPLQNIHRIFLSAEPQLEVQAGVHWSHFFGLIRLASLARVLRNIRTAENRITLQGWVKGENQRFATRIGKLMLTLVYVLHLSACLWCITARIEQGPFPGPAKATSFFPEPMILLGGTGIVNSYMRAFLWAWVNLAGIGNSDSSAETTFECVVILFVHFCGATLYAVITGNVVSMLESFSSKKNEVSSNAAVLLDFMQECDVPLGIQDRIMQGYVMHTVLSDNKQTKNANSNYGEGPSLLREAPVFPCTAAGMLPQHLRQELMLYSKSEAFRRRDNGLRRSSQEFLLALAGSLKEHVTMLPGDYLFEEGDPLPRQLFLIDSGTMEVVIDGKSARTLCCGDTLGKEWILLGSSARDEDLEKRGGQILEVPNNDGEHDANNSTGLREAEDTSTAVLPRAERSVHNHSNWSLKHGMAGMSVRAMTPCTLSTGLSLRFELKELRRRFPNDFALLEAEAERSHRAKKKIKGVGSVMKAAITFKKNIRTHQLDGDKIAKQ